MSKHTEQMQQIELEQLRKENAELKAKLETKKKTVTERVKENA